MEYPTYEDDLKIVAYIRKKQVLALRKRRQEYIEYKEEYKNKMIQFLTSIFDPVSAVIKTRVGDLVLPKFSIFEGLKSEEIPKIEDLLFDDTKWKKDEKKAENATDQKPNENKEEKIEQKTTDSNDETTSNSHTTSVAENAINKSTTEK